MPEPATSVADFAVPLEAANRHQPGISASSVGRAPQFAVAVFDSLAAAGPVWRRLETDAVLTPYQRFDWIRAMLDAWGAESRLAIVAIDMDGDTVALLPLEISRHMGINTANIIGSRRGNADWMIVHPRAAAWLTGERLLDLLRTATGKGTGTDNRIDVIALYNQPESWAGLANPLLGFSHQPGPDHLYLGALQPNGRFDRFDDKRLASIRRRTRKVSDALGPVAVRRASTIAEVDTIHRTFLEQRGARFEKMGIANIFAEPEFVRFFRDTAIAGLGEAQPALAMHALYAGDTIVGTAVGTYCNGHYSQYMNATTGGDIAKHRLIGLLAFEVFNDVAASGVSTIDFGLGDFDYKTDWTDPAAVYDAVIPLTVRGQVAAAAMLGMRRLRRAIKQNDRLFGAYKKLRAKLGRKGGG